MYSIHCTPTWIMLSVLPWPTLHTIAVLKDSFPNHPHHPPSLSGVLCRPETVALMALVRDSLQRSRCCRSRLKQLEMAIVILISVDVKGELVALMNGARSPPSLHQEWSDYRWKEKEKRLVGLQEIRKEKSGQATDQHLCNHRHAFHQEWVTWLSDYGWNLIPSSLSLNRH